MSSSFEKSVKGATKIKAAPPKTKYIEHILVATHSGESGVAEVFRSLQNRLHDSTWTVVFKALITTHLMIREGSPNVTLSYLAKHRDMLALGNITDAQTQGRNIRRYSSYLAERAKAYRDTNIDWVRASETRLEKTTVDRGLLRETECVQRQLGALLKCDVLELDSENEITYTVFRLLVLDLLALFQVLNQGLINILGHFFEMSKPDAQRAMDVYRNFTRQTDYVVAYLGVARRHEHHTGVEVPKLKHAPVNLGKQLELYLRDPDFDLNRRQYIAEQQGKKGSSSSSSKALPKVLDLSFPEPAPNSPFYQAKSGIDGVAVSDDAESQPRPAKGPDPDLIDFFDSIEQNQTTMQVSNPTQLGAPISFQPQSAPAPHQAAFMPMQPTDFQQNAIPLQQPQQFGHLMQQQQPQPLQPNFTSAGFVGYTPQPRFQPGALASISQDSIASFQNQQQMPLQQTMQSVGQPALLQPMQTGSTNPFRQSMLMQQQSGISSPSLPENQQASTTIRRQSTNPFAHSSPQASSPFNSTSTSQFRPPSAAPLQPTPTGTNPFARTAASPPQPAGQEQHAHPAVGGPLAPQPTGTTNPFRQGAFVNHATGMGWQHNQMPMGGGLDQLSTTPVFPRPAQQTPWQQQWQQ